MSRPEFLSLRMTPARRAAIDELAAVARLDGDAATLDFALGYTLAHLTGGKETNMGNQNSLRDRAIERVERSPRLARHSAVILYEWERESDDHWRWVAVSPEEEIIDWAQAVDKEAE